MKKKVVIFILLVISINLLISQNFNIFDRNFVCEVESNYDYLFLGSDGLLTMIDSDGIKTIYNYTLEFTRGLSSIYVTPPIPIKKTDTNIILTDSILFLAGKKADSDGKYLNTYFLGYSTFYSYAPFVFSFPKFQGTPRIYKDASSYLIERTKSYPIENLCNIDIATPWVENAPGYGIGECFTIENTWGRIYSTLLIMNGYISYEKPYLYEQNSRIKKIRVTGVKSGKTQVLEVLDTPHPQTVDISFITEPEDLRVTIEDVYPGTKYEDTCIQFLITWDETVIPYENSIN